MKRKLSFALAGILCFGTASLNALPQFSGSCFTASAQPTCVDTAGAWGESSSPSLALASATTHIQDFMIAYAGYECGPCRIPEACTGGVTNLSSSFDYAGPDEVSPGVWFAAVSYTGCYHVVCSGC